MVRLNERQRRSARLLRAGVLAASVAIVLAQVTAADVPALQRFTFTETHMGMRVKLVLYAPDEASANRAAAAAYRRVGQIDAIMSDYKPESELSRLSGTAGQGRDVPVGADLWRVLTAAQSLSEKSNGAFDATVGPLVKLWRRARREQQMPSSGRLEEARSAVGYQHLKLDPAARTARLERPGMRLDLGGIAAGYAMDEALAVLRSQGVSRALLDASGDIVVGDPPPHQRGWRIGVAPRSADGPPSQYVLLSNSAVTTSGDAFQHVEIGGKRYSHIVDPHTGLGLTDRSAVTLIAHDGITADSYATAVCVLGPKRGLELVEATPGAAALIVREVEGKVDTHQSATWKDALAPPKHAADKPGT